MNIARSSVYIESKKLMDQGSDFQIVNQYGEHKTFKRGERVYNETSLKTHIRLSLICEDQLTVKRI